MIPKKSNVNLIMKVSVCITVCKGLYKLLYFLISYPYILPVLYLRLWLDRQFSLEYWANMLYIIWRKDNAILLFRYQLFDLKEE